jgi:CHAD domain-containing protein
LQALAEEKHKKKRGYLAGLDFLTGYALGQRLIAQGHIEETGADYPFGFEKLVSDTVADVHKPHYNPGTRRLLDLGTPLLIGLLRDFDQATSGDLEDYEQLHRVRILGKRLRYAMEVFADCYGPPFRDDIYKSVEQMQEILGAANDSHVAVSRLTHLRARIQALIPDDWKRLKPGIEGLLRFHEKRLPLERKHFLEWWAQWQRTGVEAAFLRLVNTAQQAG